MHFLKLLPFTLIFCSVLCFAQQKKIDKAFCDAHVDLKLTEGKTALLSDNGEYLVFSYGSKSGGDTLVLKSTFSDFSEKLFNTGNPTFTADSRFFLSVTSDKRLRVYDLKKRKSTFYNNVDSYTVPNSISSNWIYYMSADTRDLIAVNLLKGLQDTFKNVNRYFVNKNGAGLAIEIDSTLFWYDQDTRTSYKIKTVNQIRHIIYNNKKDGLAFMDDDGSNTTINYFNIKSKNVVLIADNNSSGIDSGFKLDVSNINFTSDDQMVCFRLKKVLPPISAAINHSVKVWSFQDIVLMPQQIADSTFTNSFLALSRIGSHRIMLIEDVNLRICENYLTHESAVSSEFVLLETKVNHSEFYWNGQLKELYLLSLQDGTKKKIVSDFYPSFSLPSITKNGKFIVWFSNVDKNYYSQEIATGLTRNISNGITTSLVLQYAKGSMPGTSPFGCVSNPVNDNDLFIYDRVDIWKIDLKKNSAPINLTQKYNPNRSTCFRFMPPEFQVMVHNGLFISGIDTTTKQNSLWHINLDTKKIINKLTPGNHVIFFEPTGSMEMGLLSPEFPGAFPPVKAKYANWCVFRKVERNTPPDLFLTNDFKNIKNISNISKYRKFSNFNTQLLTWKLNAGDIGRGLLHLPKDLDTNRQYPLLFTYYEQRTDLLNTYRLPELSFATINIPWYVSRGYIVFEPDFYWSRGKTAESIIDVIQSSVDRLSKLKFVDTARMGINGMSHGGYITNVVATNTTFFKAACDVAGYSNIISEYGSLRPGGFNNQSGPDVGQRNLGVTPWEHPDVFIRNSPIFNVHKMTSPLLIIHNRDDVSVSFNQGVEMFLAARRAKKRVWLLEYDQEGHGLSNEENQLDFTIRMEQFFDHFLKNKAAPVWMTKGVSAIESKYLDGLTLEN